MVYNIFFEVAALCFMLIVFVFHTFQYNASTASNKKFRTLLAIGILSDFFDFFTAITISYFEMLPLPLNTFLNAVNFVLMAGTGFAYCCYVAFVLGIDKNSKSMIFNRILFAAFIIASVFNMFFGFFFYFDPEKGYLHGDCYLVLIAVSYYYVLYAFFELLINQKTVSKRVTYSAGVYAIAILVCAIIQIAFFPDILLYGFGVGLASIIVFFSLETPDYQKLQTTLKQLEQAKSEAERSNIAKSTFLAQMSHEIRTPINAVLGMNEMILRETKEEATLEYASNAYNAGNSLLSIINDILDISKIEAGKMDITETEYELFSLVSDCYLMIADRAEKKGLSFTAECDETLPSKLSGDMFHIRQIAINFLTNAVKYTDEGSVKLTFSGERSDGGFSLRISVRDTGIGLTEESRENLFDRFERFELERNQFVEGTGLGLSISRQLAELMGGRIEVESVYGEGSEFTCVIPQKITNDAPIGKVQPGHSVRRISAEDMAAFTAPDACVLVVDDVEMNLVVFTSLLKSSGMRIDTADSGKRCLEMIARQKYDIIFMDHMMPEMSGIETFRKMRETEHPNKDTPVVMLTANAILGEREKYISEGFVSYLTKPIQSDKLNKILLEYLPEEKLRLEERAGDGAVKASDKALDSAPDELTHIDVPLGLSYSADSMDVYIEILQSYVKAGSDMLANIRRSFEDKDYKSYVIEVHALKGMSLNIGAKQLSEAARELETAGKNGDYALIESRNAALIELYEKVLGEGRRYLDKHAPEAEAAPTVGVTEISFERFAEYIERIRAACLEYDGEKVCALCDEAGAYSCRGEDLRSLLREVRALAEEFECEKAAERAEELLKSEA